jgi:hypothetical protein
MQVARRAYISARSKVRTCVLKQALPDKGLTQQKLDILFGPISGWKGLKEHHDLLCLY